MLLTIVNNDFHFHLFSLLICNPHFLSWKAYASDNKSSFVVMDQDQDDDFSQSEVDVDVNEDVPGNNEREKSNKSNKWNFASSYSSALKDHIKIHSEEKSKKCNHCDYVTSQTSHLRRHLKTHCGEKSNKCNQ